MKEATLIKSQGDHRNLICYRKAEIIYDITCLFAYAAFERGNRTIDQMVQAARSGKQNIIEGNADIETSIEMGIKLINVAKASFKELLADYEDYLRVNGYELWREDSDKFIAMRKLGVEGSSQSILDIAKSRSDLSIRLQIWQSSYSNKRTICYISYSHHSPSSSLMMAVSKRECTVCV